MNAGVPGESSNMFSYQGPRGLKVSVVCVCVLVCVYVCVRGCVIGSNKKSGVGVYIYIYNPTTHTYPLFTTHPLHTHSLFTQVRGVVLPEEVERAVVGDYLRGVHVVVGLPSLLRQVLDRQRRRGMEEEDLLSCVRVVIVDEVDECFTVCVWGG